jgi:UDP-glucose 4-epimerase
VSRLALEGGELSRFVITGGGGFLSPPLARVLASEGHKVVVVSRQSVYGVANVAGSGLNAANVRRALANGADVLIHNAWATVPRYSDNSREVEERENIRPTLEIIEACSSAGVGLFVFASTGALYGSQDGRHPIPEDAPKQPLSAYGAAKWHVEEALAGAHARGGPDILCLRYAPMYGLRDEVLPRSGAVNHFLGAAASGGSVRIFGEGGIVRDFLYSEDALAVTLDLLKNGVRNRVLNVGTASGWTLLDVVALVEQACGRKLDVVHEPAAAVDPPYMVMENSALRSVTRIVPRPLEQGIAEAWAAIARRKLGRAPF